MKEFAASLVQIREHLKTAGVEWCLIGGLAVGARTEPRFTKDLDLAVATADDESSEQLIFTLQGAGYRVLAILEQQATGRLATARLSPPGSEEPMVIDLLFASSGIEPEVVARAESLEIFAQVTVPVACMGDLIAMKVLARNDQTRPQDRMDLKAMLLRAEDADREIARQALMRISSLGHGRGRELLSEFQATEHEFGAR